MVSHTKGKVAKIKMNQTGLLLGTHKLIHIIFTWIIIKIIKTKLPFKMLIIIYLFKMYEANWHFDQQVYLYSKEGNINDQCCQ